MFPPENHKHPVRRTYRYVLIAVARRPVVKIIICAERNMARAAGSAGPAPVGANGQRQEHHEDARRPDQALPRLAWTGPAAMGANAEVGNVIGNNCSVMQ
jgi:hypothetical protein